MATSLRSQAPILTSFLFLVFLSHSSYAGILRTCHFDAIYLLGNSIPDTGNLTGEDPSSPFARILYGETGFRDAMGRWSHGLLMLDYLAESAGIRLLHPYLNSDRLFTRGRGVDFDFIGSIALPVDIPAENGVSASVFSRQLDWMSTDFSGLCRIDEAHFMVGEIGGEVYNYALFQGKSFDEIRSLTPMAIQSIRDTVKRVVGYGATRVVVSGNFPIGYLPIHLIGFQSNDSRAYDKFHSVKDLNNLSIHRNSLLKQAVEELRIELPNVIIVYGDYHSAYLKLLHKVKTTCF